MENSQKFVVETPLDDRTPEICKTANGTEITLPSQDFVVPHKVMNDDQNCCCYLVSGE